MVHDRIRCLLEDAFLSSFLTHTAGVLGDSIGAPMHIFNSTIPMEEVREIYRFRQQLLSNSQSWPRPYTSGTDIQDAFAKEEVRDYLRASSVEIPADLFAWIRSGKRVWFVEQNELNECSDSPLGLSELDRLLPSSSTMIWLEEPVSTEYKGKVVTCNLVLYTKVGNDWFVRLFCNPQQSVSKPLVSIAEQKKLATWVLAKPTRQTKPMCVAGKNMYLPANKAKALMAVQQHSNSLVEYYEPGGMAGSLLGVVRLSTPELMMSAHLNDLVIQVVGRTAVWCKSFEQNHERTFVQQSSPIGQEKVGKEGKKMPRVQTVFAPEEVFLIRHTRQLSSSNRTGTYNQGTDRVVSIEHTRSSHWRTLYRGTDRERKIWVNEAHIVPKEVSLNIPRGVLLKPCR